MHHRIITPEKLLKLANDGDWGEFSALLREAARDPKSGLKILLDQATFPRLIERLEREVAQQEAAVAAKRGIPRGAFIGAAVGAIGAATIVFSTTRGNKNTSSNHVPRGVLKSSDDVAQAIGTLLVIAAAGGAGFYTGQINATIEAQDNVGRLEALRARVRRYERTLEKLGPPLPPGY